MIGAAYSWLTSCNRHSRKRLATPISVWHSTSKNKSRFSSYGTITKFIQFSWVWNICCGFIAFWYEFDFIWYPYHLLITHITVAKKQRKAKPKNKIEPHTRAQLRTRRETNMKYQTTKCYKMLDLQLILAMSNLPLTFHRPKVQLAVVHQWITQATQFPTIPPPPCQQTPTPHPLPPWYKTKFKKEFTIIREICRIDLFLGF